MRQYLLVALILFAGVAVKGEDQKQPATPQAKSTAQEPEVRPLNDSQRYRYLEKERATARIAVTLKDLQVKARDNQIQALQIQSAYTDEMNKLIAAQKEFAQVQEDLIAEQKLPKDKTEIDGETLAFKKKAEPAKPEPTTPEANK